MHRSKRLLLMLLVLATSGCGPSEPRVERVDGSQSTPLPLKLESMSGIRDGEVVIAEPVFKSGNDSLQLQLHIRLGPPITFASGNYRAQIQGQTSDGPIVSDSLSFLGGQNALPSVGGVFRLQDNSNGRTVFRVTMPPTPIKR